jgi:hypothetical protein
MDEEIWRSIRDFSSYGISSYGNVINWETNEYVTPVKNRETKEIWVSFTHYEYSFRGPVWLLMLQAFYDVMDLRSVQVDYRDGNPSNLEIFNLQWNDLDGVPIMFRMDPDGTWRRIRHKARRVLVVETGNIYESVNECAEAIGGIPNLIYMCLRGAARRHHGFTFQYEE